MGRGRGSALEARAGAEVCLFAVAGCLGGQRGHPFLWAVESAAAAQIRQLLWARVAGWQGVRQRIVRVLLRLGNGVAFTDGRKLSPPSSSMKIFAAPM